MASLFNSYDFQPDETYIAAVSGGSDSTALLFLLKAYLDKHHPGARLIAATVDHGLRAGSDTEAQAVGRLCRAHGVDHLVLNWLGQKPKQGIQAAARLARHKLLAELATRENAVAVFVGHTQDDQAETILMRGARGMGQGAAGIAPATLFDSRVWFLRPLLDVSRNALRDLLLARDIGWVDDPSNQDGRFERARLRGALAEDSASQSRKDDALALGKRAAEKRYELSRSVAGLLSRHVLMVSEGLLRLDRNALQEERTAAVHLLRVLIAVAGGSQHLPDAPRVGELLDRLRNGRLRANLARALIDARSDAIYLLREKRGLPTSQASIGIVWDRRWQILEGPQVHRVESSRLETAPGSLIREAAATLPDLSEGQSIRPVVAPWIDFLPYFDLAAANAVSKLLGAAEFDVPPFRGHIEDSA